MKFRVISGDLSRRSAIYTWIPHPVINWGLTKESSYQLSPGALQSLSVLDQESKKSGAKVGAVAGAGCCLFGPLGMLAGLAVGGKRHLVVQGELADGRLFVAQVDQQSYNTLLRALKP